jgi:hypothetical protein
MDISALSLLPSQFNVTVGICFFDHLRQMVFPSCHCARDLDSKILMTDGGIFVTPLSVILAVYKPYFMQE